MYFACDWEINKDGIEDIIPLTDAVAELKCIWFHRLFFGSNDLAWARFIVEMPSEAVFKEFLRLVKDLVFKDWYSIELAQSELPPSNLKPMGLSQWSPNSQTILLNGYYETAYLNEMRKRGEKYWL